MQTTVRKQRKHRKKQTKRVYYGGTIREELINRIRQIRTLAQWNASNINSWDISRIKNLSFIFKYFPKISDNPLTLSWNTEHVTNMTGMFHYCKQNFILQLKTQNVTDMSFMFANAINFNQPLNFNTSKVTDMSYMFYSAINFNQPLNFDTSNVIEMSSMFENARSFNQPIYFKNPGRMPRIFDCSPMEGQEKKYVLPEHEYNALILGTMLEQRNPEATLTYLLNK